jgi:hypothetical protein
MSAGNDPAHRQELFLRAHNEFQNFVAEQAWDSSDPLVFHTHLPGCREPSVHVDYCEGRPWATEDDRAYGMTRVSRAFCPRANAACELYSVGTPQLAQYPLYGARLYPELKQDWRKWSRLELLAAVNVTPYVAPLDLGDPTEYVPRLCGWINRLNEIRERLRCSACGALMKPNYKYAENLARYNATVVSCDGGPAHDGDVYLNHCRACRTIIDSRDCRIRIDGYYLCLKCGSGPQHSKTFRQGDLCPRAVCICMKGRHAVACQT